MGFVPPHAAARGSPAGCHVFEDVFRGLEILGLFRVVVDFEPGQGPPEILVSSTVLASNG